MYSTYSTAVNCTCTVYQQRFTYGTLWAPPKALSIQIFIIMACCMKFAHCRLWEALVKTHKYCIYWPLFSQYSIYCTYGSLRALPTSYSGRISYYRPFSIKFCLMRTLGGIHEDPKVKIGWYTAYSTYPLSAQCLWACSTYKYLYILAIVFTV
jgi:hypothetical protein